MTNPSFEEIMDKILTETHRMTVREQKLEQDKALSIQFQRSFYPRQGGYFQGGGRRGRSYGRGGTAPFSNGNHHCGSQVEAVGSSTVKTAWGEIKLGNILYVPTLKCSLLLVGSLTEQGHIIVFTDSQCIIHEKADQNWIAKHCGVSS